MGHIKEPNGVDLNVGPMTLSAEDRQAVSAVIAQYKLTKEVPKSKSKMAKTVGMNKTDAGGVKRRKMATKKKFTVPSK